MAVIYLRHPDHGTKVAVSNMEADGDMQNGWESYDPYEPVEKTVELVEEKAAPPANELEVKRRRGRPPAETTA